MQNVRSDAHDHIVEFKKAWLQHQTAYGPAAPSSRGDPGRAFLMRSQNAVDLRRTMFTSDVAGTTGDHLIAALSRHAALVASSKAASSVPLNIPRFPKYGMAPEAHGPARTDSSGLTEVKTRSSSDYATWHRQRGGEPALKLIGASESSQAYPRVRDEPAPARIMIDINKPPPSPTHSQGSVVAPPTPCSADSAQFPSSYPSAMDYTLPASPATWIKGGSSANRSLHLELAASAATPMPRQRQSPPAACPLPRQRQSPSSGLLQLPELGSGAPHDLSRVRPAAKRSWAPSKEQQQQQVNAAERRIERQDRTLSLFRIPAAHSTRKPRKDWGATDALGLFSLRRRGSEESADVAKDEDSHGEEEDEEEDEEEEGGSGSTDEGSRFKHRSSSEEAEESEMLSKGGSPKACLHCGTTKTPLWRNGPPGPKSLCNACGIRFNKIRSGKRKPTPKEASLLAKYERSNSVSSDISAVISGSPVSDRRQQPANHAAPRVHTEPLPVATAQKCRSKLAGPRSAPWTAKEAAWGKRALEEEEDEDEERPLGLVLQHKSKRLCLGSREGGQVRISRPLWAPRDREIEEASALSEESGQSEEERGHESSSDQESCLSEPGALSLPESPKGGARRAGMSRGLPVSKMGGGGLRRRDSSSPEGSTDGYLKEDDGESDVEIGARLLMEIFHNATPVYV